MKFDEWDQLAAAVSRSVQAGDIGTPRAARITLHLFRESEESDAVSGLTEYVVESASQWFGAEPSARWPTTPDEHVEVVMVKWPNGASALISASQGTRGRLGGDFALLGSRGSIYHRFEGSGN